MPLHTLKFIASHCLNCLSHLCLFLCSYLHFLELLLSYSFFFHLQGARAIILRDKHLGFFSYSSPGPLSCSFLGLPNITEGGPRGPNWPISRINPESWPQTHKYIVHLSKHCLLPILKLIINSFFKLPTTGCIPHHDHKHAFGYPMKNGIPLSSESGNNHLTNLTYAHFTTCINLENKIYC